MKKKAESKNNLKNTLNLKVPVDMLNDVYKKKAQIKIKN